MHYDREKITALLRRFTTVAKVIAGNLWRSTRQLSLSCWRLLRQAGRTGWYYLKLFSAIAVRRLTLIARETWLLTVTFVRSVEARWPVISKRLDLYVQLTRLNRPIGIFLLLWPTLWALWIAAEGVPDYYVLLVFVSGVVLMRSAGCVINDIADRNLDLHVHRTRGRPITTGRISVNEALSVALVLVLIAFLLVLTLNSLTIKLSVVALLLAAIYPFMKRYTYLPQLFLGLAFAWAIPMAFAAQTNTVPVITWLLLLATVLWTMVYDTFYAMVDREDDIRAGIKSTAVLFEDADRFIVGIIQVLVLVTLLFIGNRAGLGDWYYAGIGVASLFSIYQQYLIKDRIPRNCFRAFLNNHWFGATVFAGICLHYIVQSTS